MNNPFKHLVCLHFIHIHSKQHQNRLILWSCPASVTLNVHILPCFIDRCSNSSLSSSLPDILLIPPAREDCEHLYAIFASSGPFLKPGETENKRTIQTEVNSHGSMLISGHSIARKSEKRSNISNNGEQMSFGLMQLKKTCLNF